MRASPEEERKLLWEIRESLYDYYDSPEAAAKARKDFNLPKDTPDPIAMYTAGAWGGAIYVGLKAKALKNRIMSKVKAAEGSKKNQTYIDKETLDKLEISPRETDYGILNYFGTPSNQLKYYGAKVKEIIDDIHMSERDFIVTKGARDAESATAINSLRKSVREKFFDIFEGVPIEAIFSRTDLTTLEKATLSRIRQRKDADNAMLRGHKMEDAVPYASKVTERGMRGEGLNRKATGKSEGLPDTPPVGGSPLRQKLVEARQAELARRKTKKGAPSPWKRFDTELITRTEKLIEEWVPKDWGVKDYLSHIFPGDFMIYKDGTLLASGGSAENAVGALMRIAADSAETGAKAHQYKVTQKHFVDPDLVRLSSRKYWKLIADIAREGRVTTEAIEAAVRGKIGTKEGKAAYAFFLKQRKGFEGYSKDIAVVEQIYNTSMARYLTNRQANRDIKPAIEKYLREGGKKGVADELMANFNILKSHRGPGGKVFDDFLSRLPVIKYFSKPYALERWTSRFMAFTYTAFLGLSPRFHVLNRMQVFETLWPIVKTRELWEGRKLYDSPEGRLLLDKYGVQFVASRGRWQEYGRGVGKKLPIAWRDISRHPVLKYFQPETSNQELAFLTLYLVGKNKGMSDSTAARYGFLRGNVFSQFVALRTDSPRALYRSWETGASTSFKRIFFQFRRFQIKNIEMGIRLIQDRSWAPFSKWLLTKFLLGGTRSLLHPVTTIGATMGFSKWGYLTDKSYWWLVDNAPGGEATANFIHFGLPGWLGMDLSMSMQLLDVPWGQTPKEKLGSLLLPPVGTLAWGMVTDYYDNKGVVSEAYKRVSTSVIQRTPSLRMMYLIKQIFENDYSMYDPQGELQFRDDWYRAVTTGLAFRPLDRALADMESGQLRYIKEQRDWVIDQVVSELWTYILLGKPAPPDVMKRASKPLEDYNTFFGNEFGILWSDIEMRVENRAKEYLTPEEVRMFDKYPQAIKYKFIIDKLKREGVFKPREEPDFSQ